MWKRGAALEKTRGSAISLLEGSARRPPEVTRMSPQTAPRGGRILASSSDAIGRALAGVERSSMSGELNR